MPPLRVAFATACAALRARALRTSAPAASTVTTEPSSTVTTEPSRGPQMPNTAGEKNTTPPPREQNEKVADGAPMAHGTDYEAGGTPPKSTTQKARTHFAHLRVASPHVRATRRARRARYFSRDAAVCC
jgi:hypothetical protein